MKIFKSKLMNRIALGKTIGFVFGILAFLIMPHYFTEATPMLQWAMFFWYITLGAVVGVFGVMTEYPLGKITIPYWFRGIWVGAWMNFILALFIYNDLVLLMATTDFAGWSPFWIVLEGAFFGLIVDFITTKKIGEGKKLIK